MIMGLIIHGVSYVSSFWLAGAFFCRFYLAFPCQHVITHDSRIPSIVVVVDIRHHRFSHLRKGASLFSMPLRSTIELGHHGDRENTFDSLNSKQCEGKHGGRNERGWGENGGMSRGRDKVRRISWRQDIKPAPLNVFLACFGVLMKIELRKCNDKRLQHVKP